MKKYILGLVVFLVSVGFAQQQFNPIKGQLFKTYTTFTATSDDTTGVVSIPMSDNLLFADYVAIVGVATDSINADVYVIGTNSVLSTVTTTYADSLIGTSNTSNSVTIVLKSSTLDRLPACTRFKVGTVFRSTAQGTTAGRTCKWYLVWEPKSN